jgi:peptidoglycan/LPS O-acetylase OafA/YrhL
MFPKNKTLAILLLIVFMLLLIPLIAMQITNQVNWSKIDFIVAGILLFGTSLAIEIVFRKINNKKQRIIVCIIILFLLLLLWAELSVGIFGTPISGS